MADLRVTDEVMTQAQATFRAAADKLGPVARAAQGLDDQVVGTNALESMLADANPALATKLQIIGQALTELAAHTGQASTAYGHTDQDLGHTAGSLR